jgi:hypothetical protein
MENTFDLKKFLVENKLTLNSRLIKEEDEFEDEDDLLPSTYLDSYEDVTEEFLTKYGLGQYAHTDEEGLGFQILDKLKEKGINATPIGDMDADNESDYGAEVYHLIDLGNGFIAAIDDYTYYLGIYKQV